MGGLLFDEYILKEIIDEINSNPMLDGITISGGDPFYDPYALAELCQILKQETGKHILVYTGYTIERLIASERLSAPLPYIDTLIDGPYIASLRDPSILFRGSSNQRIINVKRYLQEHPLPDIV